MIERVSVLIPHDTNSACPQHTANAAWAAERWRQSLPDTEVIVAGVGRHNRAANRNALARAASGDMLLWFDGDAVVADPQATVAHVAGLLSEGVPLVRLGGGVRWLGRPTTVKLLRTEPQAGAWPAAQWPAHMRVSASPQQGGDPSRRHGGLMYATTRRVWERVPWDEQFVDWGREDTAWCYAIERLVGRGRWAPQFAWHLWHPRTRQHRWQSDTAQANDARWQAYRAATDEQLQEIIGRGSGRNLWY